MDSEFLQSIHGVIGVWNETGRDGTPNVCVPIDKLEGFVDHLADVEKHRALFAQDVDDLNALVDDLKLKLESTKTVADAALFQMQANAERMDTAELRLGALRQEG